MKIQSMIRTEQQTDISPGHSNPVQQEIQSRTGASAIRTDALHSHTAAKKNTAIKPSMFIGISGKDIISFGSGQPDLPPPEQIYSILKDFRGFMYGTVAGDERLRSALCREYPNSHPDSFAITNGASEALDLTMRIIAKHDRRPILIPRPYYYSYPHLAAAAGLDVKFLDQIDGRIPLELLEESMPCASAILINSPSNPTGMIESIKTLKALEKLASDHGTYIISDEVYKDMIYERENYLIEGEKVITINSFSKTFSMCGVRIGYLWSRDEEFVQDVLDLKSHTSMNTNIIAQEMALVATSVPKSLISDQKRIWQSRRDLIYRRLQEIGLNLHKPEGAFYAFPKIADPEKVCLDLWTKHKIITYPGTWFGADGNLRLSYALDCDKIDKGVEIIGKYINGE